MVNELEFWGNLLVNFHSIEEEWDKESKNLKSFILSHKDSDQQKLISFILESKTNPDIEKVLENKNAKVLQAIRKFYNKKVDLIEEFFNTKLSIVLTEYERLNPFFALLKLYKKNPNSLNEILIFHKWRLKRYEERYIIKPKITQKELNIINNSLENIRQSIMRRHKGIYKFGGSFSENSTHYFYFKKRKGPKVKDAYEKGIPYREKAEIIFTIDMKENLLEVRSDEKKPLELIPDILNRRIKLSFYNYEEGSIGSFDINKFNKSMTSLPRIKKDDISIVSTSFKKLNLENSCPMELPKRVGQDLRNSLSELQDKEIIDMNDLTSLSRIRINYNGIERWIYFDRMKDGTINPVLRRGGLNKNKEDNIKELFLKQYGIPLGDYFETQNSKESIPNLLNEIFSTNLITKTNNPKLIETVDLLSNLELIKSKETKIYRCTGGCRNSFDKFYNGKCPNCGGALREHRVRIKINKDKKKALDFLKNKLKIEGLNIHNKLTERTYKKSKYQFINVKLERGEDIYLWLYDAKKAKTKSIFNHFEKALLPIMIVHMGPSSLNLNGTLFPQIKLSNILKGDKLDNINVDLINEHINTLSRNIESLSIKGAEEAYKSMKSFLEDKNKSYNEYDLEDDAFALMRYIFHTGEKWGKNKSNRPVPEGIIGFGYFFNNKKYLRSIIWDCKFTNKKEYDFKRGVKDQARGYVVRSSQSKTIKQYSKQLSAYITFCNELNLKKYDNFAKNLSKKIVNWKGNVILFDLYALLKLYDLVKSNKTEIEKRKNTFNKEFDNLLKKRKSKNYSHIKIDDINNLINNVLSSNPDIEDLNYPEVYSHLVSDEIKI